MRSLIIITVLCFFSTLIFVHCSRKTPDQQGISVFLPSPDKLNGWKAVGSPQLFRSDGLFAYMNGGAEQYLSCGFKQLIAQKYSNKNHKTITLELFEMETTSGAQEMYVSKTGDRGRQVTMGNEALLEEYYLNFRKGNFLVTLTGPDSEKVTIDGLLMIAKGLDERL